MSGNDESQANIKYISAYFTYCQMTSGGISDALFDSVLNDILDLETDDTNKRRRTTRTLQPLFIRGPSEGFQVNDIRLDVLFTMLEDIKHDMASHKSSLESVSSRVKNEAITLDACDSIVVRHISSIDAKISPCRIL